jgi:hypothetical protein
MRAGAERADPGEIVLGSSVGLIWVHLAPDGSLRRPRR